MTVAYRGITLVHTNTEWLAAHFPQDAEDVDDLKLLVAAAVGADSITERASDQYRFDGPRLVSFFTNSKGFVASVQDMLAAPRPIVLPTADPMVARLVLSFRPGECHMKAIRGVIEPYGLWGTKLLEDTPFCGKVLELCVPALAVKSAELTVAELTQAVRDVITFGAEWVPINPDK